MRGFVTAVRTLTVFPIPGKDEASLSSALPWFPATGATLGAILFGFSVLSGFLFPQSVLLTGGLVLLLQCVFTGGIHLDGLADACDALFSLTDRKKKLEIMKDSRLGTYGVLSLFFVLLIKWLLICELAEFREMGLLVLAMLISRTIQVELAVTMPYARTTEGTAKLFIEGAGLKHRVAAWGSASILAAGFGPFALLALPLALLTGWFLKLYFSRKVGGVTGDLLGAASEYVELVVLAVVVLWLQHSPWIHWPWHYLL